MVAVGNCIREEKIVYRPLCNEDQCHEAGEDNVFTRAVDDVLFAESGQFAMCQRPRPLHSSDCTECIAGSTLTLQIYYMVTKNLSIIQSCVDALMIMHAALEDQALRQDNFAATTHTPYCMPWMYIPALFTFTYM